MTVPGLLVSAPASGAGKTMVTLGLLRALVEEGVAVQPFKCGPDYIDPAFHRAASGRASFNLDSWAMGRGLIDRIAAEAQSADMALAEGAMGLFDGVASPGATGHGTAFNFDLATNIILMRQGNPANVNLDIDNDGVTRTIELFQGVGGAAPWVDLNKVPIPQADEQVDHHVGPAGGDEHEPVSVAPRARESARFFEMVVNIANALLAEAAHQLADLRTAAVHHDGPHADLTHEHDVLGEERQCVAVGSTRQRVPAVLDDHHLIGEPADVRKGLDEDVGLLG